MYFDDGKKSSHVAHTILITFLKADELCQQRADGLDRILNRFICACAALVSRSEQELRALTTERSQLDTQIANFVDTKLSNKDDSVVRIVASILDLMQNTEHQALFARRLAVSNKEQKWTLAVETLQAELSVARQLLQMLGPLCEEEKLSRRTRASTVNEKATTMQEHCHAHMPSVLQSINSHVCKCCDWCMKTIGERLMIKFDNDHESFVSSFEIKCLIEVLEGQKTIWGDSKLLTLAPHGVIQASLKTISEWLSDHKNDILKFSQILQQKGPCSLSFVFIHLWVLIMDNEISACLSFAFSDDENGIRAGVLCTIGGTSLSLSLSIYLYYLSLYIYKDIIIAFHHSIELFPSCVLIDTCCDTM
jgi:hypothetical protein